MFSYNLITLTRINVQNQVFCYSGRLDLASSFSFKRPLKPLWILSCQQSLSVSLSIVWWLSFQQPFITNWLITKGNLFWKYRAAFIRRLLNFSNRNVYAIFKVTQRSYWQHFEVAHPRKLLELGRSHSSIETDLGAFKL